MGDIGGLIESMARTIYEKAMEIADEAATIMAIAPAATAADTAASLDFNTVPAIDSKIEGEILAMVRAAKDDEGGRR